MSLVLQISNLKLAFDAPGGANEILYGVSLHIQAGEKVALVGESGSGKSVIARVIMGLMQREKGAHLSGYVNFDGHNQLDRNSEATAQLRGRALSMIFQDPTSALNPVFTIRVLFHEVLRRETPNISIDEANAIAKSALEAVSIHDPERVLDSYVFQLSGGMNQRIMIAMALANRPKLLIADEPGTALDVTVQAQTLELMRERASAEGAAVLLISHNLGVVREFADRIYVIYRGRIVEQGKTDDIFHNPLHPYTRMLLSAMPKLTGEPVTIEEGDPHAPLVVHEGGEEPEVQP